MKKLPPLYAHSPRTLSRGQRQDSTATQIAKSVSKIDATTEPDALALWHVTGQRDTGDVGKTFPGNGRTPPAVTGSMPWAN